MAESPIQMEILYRISTRKITILVIHQKKRGRRIYDKQKKKYIPTYFVLEGCLYNFQFLFTSIPHHYILWHDAHR